MYSNWEGRFFVKTYWSVLGMVAALCQAYDNPRLDWRISGKNEAKPMSLTV